jgi:hypothetical protein
MQLLSLIVNPELWMKPAGFISNPQPIASVNYPVRPFPMLLPTVNWRLVTGHWSLVTGHWSPL